MMIQMNHIKGKKKKKKTLKIEIENFSPLFLFSFLETLIKKERS